MCATVCIYTPNSLIIIQARIVKGRRHSADLLGDGKATPQNYDIHRGLIAIHSGVQPNEDSDQPKSKFTISPFQKRKIAVSHSQFVLTSTSSTVSTDKVSQGDQGEGHEEATPSLYTIFQLCIKVSGHKMCFYLSNSIYRYHCIVIVYLLNLNHFLENPQGQATSRCSSQDSVFSFSTHS